MDVAQNISQVQANLLDIAGKILIFPFSFEQILYFSVSIFIFI